MEKAIKKAIYLLCALSLSCSVFAAPRAVAVVPSQYEGAEFRDLALWVKTDIELSLSKRSKDFTLATRDDAEWQRLMDDKALDLSGLIREESSRKIAGGLPVDWLVLSSLVRTGSAANVELVLKALDKETASYPKGIRTLVVKRDRDSVRAGVELLVRSLFYDEDISATDTSAGMKIQVFSVPQVEVWLATPEDTGEADRELEENLSGPYTAFKKAAEAGQYAQAQREGLALYSLVGEYQGNSFIMSLPGNVKILAAYEKTTSEALRSVARAHLATELNRAQALVLGYKDRYLKLMYTPGQRPEGEDAKKMRAECATFLASLYAPSVLLGHEAVEKAWRYAFRPEASKPVSELAALNPLAPIPAGAFWMGSPDTEKDRDSDEMLHQVSLKAFMMGRYEVTQELYASIMGTNPSSFKSGAEAPKRPVENVSWYDAVEFCNRLSLYEGLDPAYKIDKLSKDPSNLNSDKDDTFKWTVTRIEGASGYRLPTEAEWEYACRAGTQTAFHYGDSLDASQANFDGNFPYGEGKKGEYRGTTLPVGSFAPNAFGLFDMHGNVWEWCFDWAGSYDARIKDDPRGSSSGLARTFRGGSWAHHAFLLRSANHHDWYPWSRYSDLGFRLARSFTP